MKWLNRIRRGGDKAEVQLFEPLHHHFSCFMQLLEKKNQVMSIISDMEEKHHEEYLFDIEYIRSSLSRMRADIREIIEKMIMLGGKKYTTLKERYSLIDEEINQIMPGNREIIEDDLTIPFRGLRRDRAYSVGSKNAQLGEMKVALDLPVPRGFAITAWAYKLFLDANDLRTKINSKLDDIDIRHYEDLTRISREIRDMVNGSAIPDEIAEAIKYSVADLSDCTESNTFAIRSSAIGEDTQFSFAGQYATYLNVKGDQLVDYYRKIIASKFTPKAIYYFLSHSLTDSELAMSVSCVEMVDAITSGVVYTRNPISSEDNCILISSIYGLGKYLVDGTLTPDVVCISREDRSIKDIHIESKPVMLVMSPDGGTIEQEVPEDKRELLSIDEKQIATLTDYAIRVEEHYGKPQDIEWALHRSGSLYMLQTRPLRIVEPESEVNLDEASNAVTLLSGGETVCSGVGAGKVYRLNSAKDITNVPHGAVVVAPRSFPGLVTLMDRIQALITQTGGIASHMATLAREYKLPTLVGLKKLDGLIEGEEITVDATHRSIYKGIQSDLVNSSRSRKVIFEDVPVIKILERVLKLISPLNLLNPETPDFTPDNCRTFHDISRYCHQKALAEMFQHTQILDSKERALLQLNTGIPLKIMIIPLDKDVITESRRKMVGESDLHCEPMIAFWNGIKKEGWPGHKPANSPQAGISIIPTHASAAKKSDFDLVSYAILSRYYMVLNLKLGYHFTTIESMCSDKVNLNFIRMQQKGGGAGFDKRIKRVELMASVLSAMGFDNNSVGDYLDTKISYLDADKIKQHLETLGRLTIKTKQLDMALSNEAVAEWYKSDITKGLGLSTTSDAQ